MIYSRDYLVFMAAPEAPLCYSVLSIRPRRGRRALVRRAKVDLEARGASAA